jgi:hypothetical protein
MFFFLVLTLASTSMDPVLPSTFIDFDAVQANYDFSKKDTGSDLCKLSNNYACMI